jgi:hypothetical protein
MAVLKKGSKGAAVKSLQSKLWKLGFNPGPIDGDFGNGTDDAVKAFQKQYGLKADGRVGPKTLETIQSVIDGLLPAAPDVAPPALLTEADFQYAAGLLGCDVAAVKAVAEVESAGNGFLSDGRVKILFEGHQFFKFTNGAYADSYPTVCYKKWTKVHYSKGKTADIRGAGELARLGTAIGLNREAALMSASYGKFQIMGFNYALCNYPDIESFYTAMQTSEGEQLMAFCGFIKSNKLDTHLRKHDWARFARGYNGPGYAENKYDEKLARAYAKHSK